ncbi:hypothetical protein [Umezakia ovalisporum]|uniref:CRISPR-associated protein Cas6-like N-terminal domain-containing protein n=2 Tax=Umezakia ovalisporum TaxID=75695 RepID=A0AA43KE65_9CYAN|nr:hypothetical protein [Umezakia ovalisporum]MDH6058785.1 hypothetical protein [Umezakia ovalisporum FSS-43]MDH6063239.1 hypothetical protein [Umezakia ovalisporum FSS-62]MDH6068316.1 hypothetical protein [Umezakia ovalisporum APH033B]MDH6069575.1 hypothetical protein [Umezakia ovalisporum CobakiLakeA]MDH6075304.1 hypothetical protein [Umezakia ovalisporum CS-1034]
MLHSLVLNLFPLSNIPPQFLTVRHLHSFNIKNYCSIMGRLG